MNDGKIASMFAQRMCLDKGVHLLGVSFGGCCSIGASLEVLKKQVQKRKEIVICVIFVRLSRKN